MFEFPYVENTHIQKYKFAIKLFHKRWIGHFNVASNVYFTKN